MIFFQHFETSGINLMSDSQYNGQTRVQVLLEYLQEREMDLEDLGSVRRIKLEQCIQLCQFETDANQVMLKTLFACQNSQCQIDNHPLLVIFVHTVNPSLPSII